MTAAMLALTRSAAAWSRPSFEATLVEELQTLGPNHPALRPLLQAGLTQTSAVAEAPLSNQVLHIQAEYSRIHVYVSVVYVGVIAGCGCADDSTPVDTVTEHYELLLDIYPATGAAC